MTSTPLLIARTKCECQYRSARTTGRRHRNELVAPVDLKDKPWGRFESLQLLRLACTIAAGSYTRFREIGTQLCLADHYNYDLVH